MAYVLIVDDDLDFAGAVQTALQSRGHEAGIETVADRAIPRIEQRRPDAVILDVMFPENDVAGFEVARSIRRRFGGLPVLLLTAVNQSLALGFSNRISIRRGCRPWISWRNPSICSFFVKRCRPLSRARTHNPQAKGRTHRVRLGIPSR